MPIEQSADAATPPSRIAHYMKMRAVTIQYLRMLENELIGMGGIRPQDRACLLREERRGAVHVDIDRADGVELTTTE
ncbi:MAG TPA: hypothetical protein PK205_18910 [Promineifilum sp.]|nr:hypothetical protein [Promineifilum sp.]